MKCRFSALAAGLLILSFLPSCSPEQPVLREVSYLPPKPVYTARRVTLGEPGEGRAVGIRRQIVYPLWLQGGDGAVFLRRADHRPRCGEPTG